MNEKHKLVKPDIGHHYDSNLQAMKDGKKIDIVECGLDKLTSMNKILYGRNKCMNTERRIAAQDFVGTAGTLVLYTLTAMAELTN